MDLSDKEGDTRASPSRRNTRSLRAIGTTIKDVKENKGANKADKDVEVAKYSEGPSPTEHLF